MSKLILVAASGLAREVLGAVEASRQQEVVGLLDDSVDLRDTRVHGVQVLGSIGEAIKHPEASFVVCVGRGSSRRAIVERLAAVGVTSERFATVIDPTVRLPRSCSIGVGTILLAQSVLTSDVSIGDHVVTMPHVTMTHDNQIEDYVTLCAGVSLGGGVRIAKSAYIGMGASIRERVTIGRHATVGMGSVVLRDVPPGIVVAGVPAARISDRFDGNRAEMPTVDA